MKFSCAKCWDAAGRRIILNKRKSPEIKKAKPPTNSITITTTIEIELGHFSQSVVIAGIATADTSMMRSSNVGVFCLLVVR